MSEDQKYNPVIIKHVETEGLDIGRLQNTALTRDVADFHNEVITDNTAFSAEELEAQVNDKARQLLAREAADGQFLAEKAALAASWEMHEDTYPPRVQAEKIMRAAVDRSKEAIDQYGKLQEQAKAIHSDMKSKPEIDEDTKPA